MKKLVFFLFLCCFVLLRITATSAIITKIDAHKKTDLIMKEGQNSIKIKIQDSEPISNFVQKVKEQRDTKVNIFQVCFVSLTDISYEVGIDSELYAIFTIEVHCYGIPGNNDMAFFIDKTT